MSKHYILVGLVLAMAAVCPEFSWAADFVARVSTVHEGDRLTIRHKGRNETIYLKDIDCPDLKQPYGKEAKHATASYVANRDVVVRDLTRDKQGRVSAEVLLQDGRNVGRELVKEGLAWWQRSTSKNASFEVIEELAKASCGPIPILSRHGNGKRQSRPARSHLIRPLHLSSVPYQRSQHNGTAGWV
jgi:micrococcal nuclease